MRTQLRSCLFFLTSTAKLSLEIVVRSPGKKRKLQAEGDKKQHQKDESEDSGVSDSEENGRKRCRRSKKDSRTKGSKIPSSRSLKSAR